MTKSSQLFIGHLQKTAVLFFIALFVLIHSAWPANIVRPWRATTAIVKTGENFEVWFNADNGQVVNSVKLIGPYNHVNCAISIITGDWEYDPLSGNRYNTKITVTVPAETPFDRYDLILNTSDGDEVSYGGVKVIEEYRDNYYIMHFSDGHIFQSAGEHDSKVLLARKSAMISMANIMDVSIIIETGDIMYNIRNNPDHEFAFYHGIESENIKGMTDVNAATFFTPGNHDAHTANTWDRATVQVNSDWWNSYYGLQNHSFKYGNGRFMLINNGWQWQDHQFQANEAGEWLSGDGSGGNFFLSAAHHYDKMHNIINDYEPLDLVLAGHKHYVSADNPWEFSAGSDRVAYIAGSIRDKFEFNLFRVNNSSGECFPVAGINGVVQVLYSGNKDDPSTWEPNLTLSYSNDNNGGFYENIATIDNKFDFPIEDARVRFVLPRGYDYRVTNGNIAQQFDGDEYRVIDVTLDVAANSISVIQVGDADLCPDDPVKTEPGLCGCGVEEGNCEKSKLTVNNGTGDGDYYPYEDINITADDAPTDKEFGSWVIVSGNPVILNVNDPSTQLVLEGVPAEISATYKDIIYVNDADFLSQVIPPMVPGGATTVHLSMKNTGTTTWTKAKGYALYSQNPPDNSVWGIDHVDLDDTDSIQPGEIKKFIFDITAPQFEDLYDFRWQMRQVGSGGFGEYSYNQVIKPNNSEDYLDACDQSSYWKTSGMLSLNSTDNKQGSGCLNYSGGGPDEFKRSFSTPHNARGSEEGSILQFWYYVSDISVLQEKNQVELGSAGKNDEDEYNWSLTGLADGWNYIRLPIHEATKIGTPHLSAINWFRIYRFKSAPITTRIDGIQIIGDGVITEVKLKVNSGAGSGIYAPGDRLSIQANTPRSGMIFHAWVINSGTAQLEDPDSDLTFLTMSDTDVEMTATYVTDPAISINQIEMFDNFNIYPNPAHAELRFEFVLDKSSPVHIAMHDLTGRTIIQHNSEVKLNAGNHKYTLNVNSIMPGSYIVKVYTTDGSICKKIVLE
jgi:hypothetical protein